MLQQQIKGMVHIALQLSDLDEGLRFFSEWLGFKVKFEVDFEDHRIVMLNAGRIELEMWQADVETSRGETGCGVHHLAIEVKDLDVAMAEVRSLDVPVLADIYEPTRGIREAIVQGPDGIRVQLVEQNVPLLIWRAVTGDFEG
ncbi:MAG: hypothetical protein GVY30_02870 [Chloroflexi bacterium]|jgi:lactoylglutathione lyase|nr:hypothetical protein [Chloroflexota bacterium]